MQTDTEKKDPGDTQIGKVKVKVTLLHLRRLQSVEL